MIQQSITIDLAHYSKENTSKLKISIAEVWTQIAFRHQLLSNEVVTNELEVYTISLELVELFKIVLLKNDVSTLTLHPNKQEFATLTSEEFSRKVYINSYQFWSTKQLYCYFSALLPSIYWKGRANKKYYQED